MSQEPEELNWDPAKAQREYVRNVTTGELGWFVRRDGKRMVKLDRPNQEILRRHIENEWVEEDPSRPMSDIHVSRIAFEADRELCRTLGLHLHAKREWAKLTEPERKMFLGDGPKEPPARVALFKAIKAGIGGFVKK
jgi:hypothetical protein